jgi:hypothetical protein
MVNSTNSGLLALACAGLLLSCAVPDTEEGNAYQVESRRNSLTALSSGSTSTRIHPPRKTIANRSPPIRHARPAFATPDIEFPVPFDRPGGNNQSVHGLPVVSVGGSAISADGPQTPLLQPQPVTTASTAAPITCSDSTLKLNCPAGARSSICTSAENLPLNCKAMTVPGAFYPPKVVPACCI